MSIICGTSSSSSSCNAKHSLDQPDRARACVRTHARARACAFECGGARAHVRARVSVFVRARARVRAERSITYLAMVFLHQQRPLSSRMHLLHERHASVPTWLMAHRRATSHHAEGGAL